jgi:hypothetical protein
MSDTTTEHTWMTPVALRISSSSGLPLPPAKAAPCVLDLLDHARHQTHAVVNSIITE